MAESGLLFRLRERNWRPQQLRPTGGPLITENYREINADDADALDAR